MTVTHIISGTKATGTTTVGPSYPAGTTAARLAICVRNVWLSTATLTAEGGWVDQADLAGGTGSTADNHTCRIGIDTKILAGGESGVVTFDQAGSPNGAIGVIVIYEKGASETWDIAVGFGDDASHAANRAATSTTSLTFEPGDLLLAAVSIDTDNVLTITAPAITAGGITFGATNARLTETTPSGVGFDGNLVTFDATVSSGSATVAPAFAMTTAVSQCGPVAFVRLRGVGAAVDNPPRRRPVISLARPRLAATFAR